MQNSTKRGFQIDIYSTRSWIGKAILKSFNSGDYTATIQLAASYEVYMEGTAVARNLSAAEMALGRKVAVIFFDQHKPEEAVASSRLHLGA